MNKGYILLYGINNDELLPKAFLPSFNNHYHYHYLCKSSSHGHRVWMWKWIVHFKLKWKILMDGCFSHYLNERSLLLIWGEFVVFQVAQQQESLLCFSWLNVKWIPPWVVCGLHDLERNFIYFIKKISHPNWSYLLILFRGREEEASLLRTCSPWKHFNIYYIQHT